MSEIFSNFSCAFRPPSYYSVNQEVSAGYYNFVDEYSLYLPGVRPDSICSMSAVGGYDRLWTIEQKRHSLRDEPHRLYRKQMPQDQWGPQYYGGMETSMRSLFIQPRSKSVPRSPSSSSRRPYSPASCTYASPARSPSNGFDWFSGRMNEDAIYPPVYSLRRSFSSPKVNRFTVFVCSFEKLMFDKSLNNIYQYRKSAGIKSRLSSFDIVTPYSSNTTLTLSLTLLLFCPFFFLCSLPYCL